MKRSLPLSRAARGNVLFMILIGVALFSALAYAITQSEKGNSSVSHETAAVDAALIIEHTGNIKSAVSELRLLNECTDTLISFENPVTLVYTNNLSPTDKSCYVFDRAGGGVTWESPPQSSLLSGTGDYVISGDAVIHGAASAASALTDANADLVISLGGLKQETCRAINNSLKFHGIPVNSDSLTADPFTGSYSATDAVNGTVGGGDGDCWDASPTTPNLCGRSLACFLEDGTGEYVFYRVLLARGGAP